MNKILATALLVLGMTFASLSWGLVGLQQATPGNLSAFIMPEKSDARGDTNVYMAALFQGNWFVRNGQNWEVFTGTIPVADRVSLLTGIATTLVASADLSSLPGLEVYVAYGNNESDINLTGHLAKVYTVPTPVVTTCTQTTLTTGVTTCMYPNGAKVVGANELVGSFLIGDTAWDDGMKKNIIKTVDTNEILTGFSSRPIIRAVLTITRSDGGKDYCVTPIYKDDGKAVGSYTNPGSRCYTEPFDWFVGGSDGMTLYFPGRNQCYKDYWKESALTFGSKLVTCP